MWCAMVDLTKQIHTLLLHAGVRTQHEDIACLQLQGGRNNRAFCVQAEQQKFFCKHYFRSAADTRDRQGAEWHFLRYCHANGITNVPQPLARDEASGLSLFSWCEGRKGMRADAGTSACVDKICAFLQALRDAWAKAPDTNMPPASDACLNLRDHLILTERKINVACNNLKEQGNLPLADAVRAFMEEKVLPLLETTLESIHRQASPQELISPLPLQCQFPSPSDFGVHNALIHGEQFFFVDFEYAGRDSPAKLLCDALCQPDNPLPDNILPQLCQSVTTDATTCQQLQHHVKLLLPLHRLKWVAIMLNEFDKIALRRREFALSVDSITAQKRQFTKCRQYIMQHFPQKYDTMVLI